jgi:esterase/lipase superfamily enzyme
LVEASDRWKRQRFGLLNADRGDLVPLDGRGYRRVTAVLLIATEYLTELIARGENRAARSTIRKAVQQDVPLLIASATTDADAETLSKTLKSQFPSSHARILADTPGEIQERGDRFLQSIVSETNARKAISSERPQYSALPPPKESADDGLLMYKQGSFEKLPKIPDERSVDLLFATNRSRVHASTRIKFTAGREPTLTFGAVRVNVPKDHRIGRLEVPRKKWDWTTLWFSREKKSASKHFLMTHLEILSETDFVESAQSDPAHTALIFVHGFNASFDDAALRFAQIVWDMQFTGIPILYSWPSGGGLSRYYYDLNSALFSAGSFQRLIKMLFEQAGIEKLHIIAHSMGNHLALDAMNKLALSGSAPKISELVMAAPDVDIDLFKSFMTNVQPFARGMTLYASANDRALVVSRVFARKERAGDVLKNGPLLVANVDSIDVSAIGTEMFGLNHRDFASNRSLIDDIGRLLLTSHRPPDRRSPQIRRVPEGANPPLYWRYVT